MVVRDEILSIFIHSVTHVGYVMYFKLFVAANTCSYIFIVKKIQV